MKKISAEFKVSDELNNIISFDHKQQAIRSEIIDAVSKKIKDENLISINETRCDEQYIGFTKYKTSFMIINEMDYDKLIAEIFKLERAIDIINSNYAFTLRKHLEQIKECIKLK